MIFKFWKDAICKGLIGPSVYISFSGKSEKKMKIFSESEKKWKKMKIFIFFTFFIFSLFFQIFFENRKFWFLKKIWKKNEKMKKVGGKEQINCKLAPNLEGNTFWIAELRNFPVSKLFETFFPFFLVTWKA